MNEKEKHFDHESEPRIPSGLCDDLRALCKPDAPVPGEVDRAIMDRAYQQLILKQKKHRRFRWAASATVAAAIILLVLLVDTTKKADMDFSRFAVTTAQEDIDLNGRVDILDAFKLARRIKSADQPLMEWDINGDGAVNREDVDVVAFSAVRLDKGV